MPTKDKICAFQSKKDNTIEHIWHESDNVKVVISNEIALQEICIRKALTHIAKMQDIIHFV